MQKEEAVSADLRFQEQWKEVATTLGIFMMYTPRRLGPVSVHEICRRLDLLSDDQLGPMLTPMSRRVRGGSGLFRAHHPDLLPLGHMGSVRYLAKGSPPALKTHCPDLADPALLRSVGTRMWPGHVAVMHVNEVTR